MTRLVLGVNSVPHMQPRGWTPLPREMRASSSFRCGAPWVWVRSCGRRIRPARLVMPRY